MSRPWIKVDVGLLDDDRFEGLSPSQVGVWLKAYLLVARDGDVVRDRARLAKLLGRYGVRSPAAAVADLEAAGWIEDVADGITIRGFRKHQLVYRGESDLPGRSHKRVAPSRPESPVVAPVARGDRGEERRGEETSRARTREAEPLRAATNGTSPISEIIGSFDDVVTKKRT